VVLLAAVLIAGCECGKSGGAAAEPEPPEPGPAEPLEEPLGDPDPLPAPPGGGPGVAWFATPDRGLVRLVEGRFETVWENPGVLSGVREAPDGTILAWTLHRIVRWREDRLETVLDNERGRAADLPTLIRRVAGDASGGTWAAGYGRIAYHDGRRWRTWDLSVLGEGVRQIEALEVDGDGTVWAASAAGLHRRAEDGTWATEVPAVANGPLHRYAALGRDPEGRLVALADGRVVRRVGDGFVEVRVRTSGSAGWDLLAVAPEGTIALAGASGVGLVGPGGGTARRFAAGEGELLPGPLDGIAADARGRFWLVTPEGPVVLHRDGSVVRWSPGAITSLAGGVTAVAVSGAGPDLPDAGEARRGSLRGAVVARGKPVAGATVEICRIPRVASRSTPCGDSPWHATTVTTPEGTFAFEDAPLGSYGLAVLRPKGWATTLPGFVEHRRQGGTTECPPFELRD
jgi:hypothetical protein